MEDVLVMDDSAEPVEVQGESANVAKSHMQHQVETAPLLNAEALADVLRDVPGEYLALLKKNCTQNHYCLLVAWLLTLEKP